MGRSRSRSGSKKRRSRSRDRDRDRDRKRSRSRSGSSSSNSEKKREARRAKLAAIVRDGASRKKKIGWGDDGQASGGGLADQAMLAVQAAIQARDSIPTGGSALPPGTAIGADGKPYQTSPNLPTPKAQPDGPLMIDPQTHVTPTGTVITQIEIDEKHCKFVIGKRGEFFKSIEKNCPGAWATLDNMPDGKNVVRVQGTYAGVKAGVAMVQLRLAALTDSSALPDGYTLQKIEVEPFQVKNVIGPKGETLRMLQQESECQITIQDAITAEQAGIKAPDIGKGKSQVRIVGRTEAVEKATKLVMEKVNFFEDLQVSQAKIGCIIGPKGQTFKQIRQQSGASIWVEQSTQHLGYSIVRIKNPGTREHADAKRMILEKIGGELFVGPEAAAQASQQGTTVPGKGGMPKFVRHDGGTLGSSGSGGMPSLGQGEALALEGGSPTTVGGSWGSPPGGGGNWGNVGGGDSFGNTGNGGNSWGNQGGGDSWGNASKGGNSWGGQGGGDSWGNEGKGGKSWGNQGGAGSWGNGNKGGNSWGNQGGADSWGNGGKGGNSWGNQGGGDSWDNWNQGSSMGGNLGNSWNNPEVGQGMSSQNSSDWNSQSLGNSFGGPAVVPPPAQSDFNSFNPQPQNSWTPNSWSPTPGPKPAGVYTGGLPGWGNQGKGADNSGGNFSTNDNWNQGSTMGGNLPTGVPPAGNFGTDLDGPGTGLLESAGGFGTGPAPIDVSSMDPIELMLAGEKLAKQGVKLEDLTPEQALGQSQSLPDAPAPVDVTSMDPVELMLVGEKLAEQGVTLEHLTPEQLQEYVQTGKLPTCFV